MATDNLCLENRQLFQNALYMKTTPDSMCHPLRSVLLSETTLTYTLGGGIKDKSPVKSALSKQLTKPQRSLAMPDRFRPAMYRINLESRQMPCINETHSQSIYFECLSE